MVAITIEMAKDLIRKGHILGDAELVTMGNTMLDELVGESDTPEFNYDIPKYETAKWYECQNCKHIMPVDKEGRKRCPECKKHQLKLVEAFDEVEKVSEQEVNNSHSRSNPLEGTTTVKNPNQSRVRYNDQGEADGMFTMAESVEANAHAKDEGGYSEDTELFTNKVQFKVSDRRPQQKLVDFTCRQCKSTTQVQPIHSKGLYCTSCTRRKARH